MNIEINGARQNNLKNINLKIPLGKLTVICGPSGSGKSSLAFETLFAEGHRHYTETLSHYARQYTQQLPRPLVNRICNIPPAIALEQKNKVRSWRPTVGTFTEIASCLRLMFTYLGEVFCPVHQIPLRTLSHFEVKEWIQKKFKAQKGFILASLNTSTDNGISTQHQQYTLMRKAELLRDGYRYIYSIDKYNKDVFSGKKDIKSLKSWPTGPVFLIIDEQAFTNSLIDSLNVAKRVAKKYHPLNPLVKVLSVAGESLYIGLQKACCPLCAYQFPIALQPALFNFNTALGACEVCRGFGNRLVLDENKIVPEAWKSLAAGAIEPFTMPSASQTFRALRQICRTEKIDWHSPWEKLTKKQKHTIWKGKNSFVGVEGYFQVLENQKYKLPVRVFLSRYKSPELCIACKGKRFRSEIMQVRFRSVALPDLLDKDIQALFNFFHKIKFSVLEQKKIPEVIRKLSFLLENLCSIGLGYLGLSRAVKTLSSGELQRLSLSHQLGLGLSHVLYVLDEPTVGLHRSDTACLNTVLKKLKTLENTLVVVEHDPDVIQSADYVIELGPQSGVQGGQIVFAGSQSKFLNSGSLTSRYLKTPIKKRKCTRPVAIKNYKYFLEMTGAKAYNLKNVHLRVPLNRLVCVTGPSGSGKSSLVTYTLYPALLRAIHKKRQAGGMYSTLKGASYLRRVVLVNASTIEKTRRSLLVTYLKIYDSIRELIAQASQISARSFSLNVDGGRCRACRGLGYQEIELVFMDPVRIECSTCEGKKFKPEVLKARWKGKNIHQILNMKVTEALDFFVAYPTIRRPLNFLKKVGMEYLALGQSLSTLSGGESQRLKLARELIYAGDMSSLYILDEPTVGLHFAEIELLIKLLHELVEKGSSVLLIEHNLALLTQADYLIDMGPAAGPRGGQIVAEGPLSQLLNTSQSKTSQFLRKYFSNK